MLGGVCSLLLKYACAPVFSHGHKKGTGRAQEGHKKGIEPGGYNPGCVSFILGIFGSSVFAPDRALSNLTPKAINI